MRKKFFFVYQDTSRSNCKILQFVKKLFFIFLRYVIVQLHHLFDCVVNCVFGFYYNDKAKKVPSVNDSLLLESAVSLAEKIR